jgi:hypothetical protein
MAAKEPLGPLKDDRLERFCQEIANGQVVADAMVAAGYSASSAHSNGLKILKRPYVAARVAELCELTGLAVPRHIQYAATSTHSAGGRPPAPEPDIDEIDISEITAEWVLKEAARAQKHVPAMVKLLETIGRLSGIDKRPKGRPAQTKEPNKGDVNDGKPKPTNSIGFADLIAGLSGHRDGAGDESEAEADADAEDDGSAEEI